MIGLFDIICGFLNRKLFKPIINFEPSFLGGQFALNEGGQFARNLGGQFTRKTGGQFDGILQLGAIPDRYQQILELITPMMPMVILKLWTDGAMVLRWMNLLMDTTTREVF